MQILEGNQWIVRCKMNELERFEKLLVVVIVVLLVVVVYMDGI